jgi:hypothetical protein
MDPQAAVQFDVLAALETLWGSILQQTRVCNTVRVELSHALACQNE